MRVFLVLALATLGAGQTVDPQAIQRMAATERAFAAAAAEIGTRDAFLSFFAPDAIALVPGADGTKVTIGSARASLEARPLAPLPLATRLMWEPFTGQVSGDGTMGWLTGGAVALTTATHDITYHGAYFSVWKRQPNGTWRVWLDEGVNLPDVWRDASPFRVAPDPDAGTAGTPDETLEAAERSVAAGGDGWRTHLADAVRLHRDGVMPIVGREAVMAFASNAWRTMHYVVIRSEAAGSDDLAVALGGYDATSKTGPEHGTWVRIWKRDVTARWRIVFETSTATR